MPDDPNAALIERMADAYNPDWSVRLEGETEEAHAAYLADVRRDMSRVLDVVREHEGQALAEATAQIATLTAERDEALRRRDAWRAKAEGYDEMAAAVRAKVRDAGPSAGRALLRAALGEAERRIADLAATPGLRAAAILFRCPEGFEAMAAALGIADDTEARGKLDAAFKAVARNAKENPDDNA